MKRFFRGPVPAAGLVFVLSGCSATGGKPASLSAIYGAAALCSLLLLIGCVRLVTTRRRWFLLLFSSVLVVNVGYAFLSVSPGLEAALWANRISYLGSVWLPMSMMMIILNVTDTSYRKWLPNALMGIAAVVFLIAASPGVLDIYYKEVSFQVVNGVSYLVKVYGPLHPLYLLYLLGYFTAMVMVIVRAQVRKTMDSTTHAVILAAAVLVNIGVWFVEQITAIAFEMLSISYIISELFLLGGHLMVEENRRLREIVRQVETVRTCDCGAGKNEPSAMLETPVEPEQIASECVEAFLVGLQQLTPTERLIYDAYVARATTKEVMVNLGIKESTLKYHNRNLYGKLGVSTRKELLERYKHIRAVKARQDGAEGAAPGCPGSSGASE